MPFPKSTIISLPLLVKEGQLAEAAAAIWGLYQSGVIADEYKNVKPLALVGTPVQGLSSRVPVGTLEDMRGLKVRAADKTVSDVVSALGASPISIPATEVYQALGQGVVSASVAGWVLIGSFRLDEVVKEHLEGVPLGAPAGFVIMNTNSYSSLVRKVRKFSTSSPANACRERSANSSKIWPRHLGTKRGPIRATTLEALTRASAGSGRRRYSRY